jgi:hypothetical protein
MSDLCRLIWCALIGLFRSRTALEAEILVLRHQLNVLRRKSPKRLAFSNIDRLVFAGLYRVSASAISGKRRVMSLPGGCRADDNGLASFDRIRYRQPIGAQLGISHRVGSGRIDPKDKDDTDPARWSNSLFSRQHGSAGQVWAWASRHSPGTPSPRYSQAAQHRQSVRQVRSDILLRAA